MAREARKILAQATETRVVRPAFSQDRRHHHNLRKVGEEIPGDGMVTARLCCIYGSCKAIIEATLPIQ